jgi:arsenate reductase
LLRERGVEPTIYLYLQERPGKAEIEAVLKKLKLKPSELLRGREPAAGELQGAAEAKILAAMAADPILIQRPIVISSKGAVLARPPERATEVL